MDIGTIMKTLTAEEYYSLEAPILFSEKDDKCNKMFGYIETCEHKYKFSWNSSIVEPIFELLDRALLGIGIDQHFCILNPSSGVYNCWDLATPFLYMMVYERYVVVVCEINILFISLDSIKVEKEYMFSEIISDVRVENRIMRIVFIDDSESDIPIDDNNNPYVTLTN